MGSKIFKMLAQNLNTSRLKTQMKSLNLIFKHFFCCFNSIFVNQMDNVLTLRSTLKSLSSSDFLSQKFNFPSLKVEKLSILRRIWLCSEY